MQQLTQITKALADESRLRVLCWLRQGDLCLCQIVAMLKLAPSTTSRHMAILQQAGLVTARKDGRWMHYSLADQQAQPIIAQTLSWLDDVTKGDPMITADLKALAKIRKQDPSAICDLTYGKS